MISPKIYPWLWLDLAVFGMGNSLMLFFLYPQLGGLKNLSGFNFLILSLAVYRLANIISNETVTKPLRDPFVTETHQDGKVISDIESTIWRDAPLSLFLGIFPRLALKAAPAAICCFFDRAGINIV